MPLGFLPFFQKKEKNQKQELQSQLESSSQNKAFLVTSLNLLSNVKRTRFVPEDLDKVTSLLRNLIIFLSTTLSLIILINFILLLVINNQKDKQVSLVKQVSSFSKIESASKVIDKKIVYYKKILSLRKKLSPKIEFISNKVGEDINVKDIKYTGLIFRMFADGPDAYTFTRLISEYLKGDMVSEISIKGARLNTRTGRFEIDMEGKFK